VPRDLDEPIPPDEWLFMGVAADHLAGKIVLPGAIDLEGQSVNRAKYNAEPQAAVLQSHQHVAAAGVRPENLPGPEKSLTGNEYFFHADDDPEETNPAHAEIRAHRPGIGWKKNHKISAQNRTWLKELLARKLTIVWPVD
jgi:hypothetical protein